ncbi:MAG: hypothetical protein ACLPIC_15220, partial [Rhodoblastus sp.]|uniref:hypothetical protein n=1 Tax=Rhodoblastus sp. TaxID=1962975 RepID=UPI003F95E7A3
IVKELGKQYALFSVFPLDEALHCNPRSMASQIIADSSFSHSLRRKGPPGGNVGGRQKSESDHSIESFSLFL